MSDAYKPKLPPLFGAREIAAFAVLIGVGGSLAASVALLTRTVPDDRRPTASVMASGLLVVGVMGVVKLRQLKAAEPPQTWARYLRRELAMLAAMPLGYAIVSLFPEEMKAFVATMQDFIQMYDMLRAGRP